MPKFRKMLNNWEVPCVQSLMKLIESQSKATLVTWVIHYSEKILLPLWIKYDPDDLRPQKALKASYAWLSGDIKLPEAKKAILACHAAARASAENPVAQAAARAIGQSASTIHSARHCMGLVMYGALAVAYDQFGTEAAWENIEQRASEECGRMEAALRAVAMDNGSKKAQVEWKC